MSVSVVRAPHGTPCATCGRVILKDAEAVTADGSRFWHPTCAPPPATSVGAGGSGGEPTAPVDTTAGNVLPRDILVHFGGHFSCGEGGEVVEWGFNPKYDVRLPFFGMADQAEHVARIAYLLAQRIREGRFGSAVPK
jgi:hypothetical protein